MAQHPIAADDVALQRKTRIGVRMTILYAIMYGGFMAVSVFQPSLMGAPALLGLNLAVAYGLGLIIIAIIFAVIYNYLCRVPPAASQGKSGAGSAGTAAKGRAK